MIAINVLLKPAAGKIGELRAVLKEITEHLQSTGERAGLRETVWNAEGNHFGVITLHESIARAAEARERMQADTEANSIVGRAVPLFSEPSSWSVWDVVVPTPNPKPTKFALRVSLQSSVGKGSEVRRIMTDWCEYAHGNGKAISLSEQVWGPRGGRFGVLVPINSLAEAEAGRAENAANPRYQQMAADLSGLLETPPSWELSEVIISPIRSEATNGAKAGAQLTA